MNENYNLAKWLNDELTAEELADFKKDPDYALYLKIKEASARLQTSAVDEDKMLQNILSAPKTTKVIKMRPNWFARIASVLVIAIGLSFLVLTNVKEEFYGTNELTQNVTLPDNSEVIVNKNSALAYHTFFWKKNRKIELKGEAYFKVAKGKTFEVKTALGKVTVLGTQFNVNSFADKFEVTCYEGKVKVNYNNQELVLTKGMLVTFENNIKTEGKTALLLPNWTSTASELTYTNETLATIISSIEKNYDIKIKSSTINTTKLFTGKVPSNDLAIALKIIGSTYHLEIKKSNESTYEFVQK